MRSPASCGVWLALLLCLSPGCGRQEELYSKKQVVMGTTVEVISYDEQAASIVFREMRRIEQQLSYFNVHSDVSHLNLYGEVNAGEDLLFVLRKARLFWEASSGAFDITVAPLLDLWGFRGEVLTVPDAESLKETMLLVGMDKIVVHPSGKVEFKVKGMKIDLGGIAKGYALDRAADRLRENGVESCLINCGGQVYALGQKTWGPWKTAIRDARSEHVRGAIALKNESLSTSGDYEQFFFEDEIRMSHIMNPLTGYPARNGIISVSVVSPSALEADALSTAIFVLGQERAAELVAQFPGAVIKDIQIEDPAIHE